MALTISDMTVDTTIADGSIIPFIKDDGAGGYLNRSIEAQDLKTYMQTGITPLPPGTAGKVMYYSTAWGKSANFETDGTNVAIGQTVAFKSSRLTVYDGSGSKDYTLFLQNGNTKLVTHKFGTTFIGNYDTNKETSGFGTAIKLFNQGNFYNESDIITTDTIKFGTIDNDGIITTKSKIYGGNDLFISTNSSSEVMLFALKNISSENIKLGTNIESLTGSLYGGQKIKINSNTTNLANETTPKLMIGSGNAVNDDEVIVRIHKGENAMGDLSDLIMDIMNDGTIRFFNQPTSSAGLASGTLWIDSGTLKLA